MYEKTSGLKFLKYGQIVSNHLYQNDYKTISEFSINKNNIISEFFKFDKDIIIECLSGIVMLYINDQANISGYVMHRTVQVKKDTFINILALTENANINILLKENTESFTVKLNEPFIHKYIKKEFEIREIYAFYHSVRSPGYIYKGEINPHFEITYVDNGSLQMKIGDQIKIINENELIISGANTFHNQVVYGDKPCSYLTIIFDSNLSDKQQILGKVYKLNNEYIKILNRFVNNANDVFKYQGDLYINDLKSVILYLLRYSDRISSVNIASPLQEKIEMEILERIYGFVLSNITQPITLNDICEQFSLSRSSLQKIFKKNLNVAPKQFINEIKLKKACLLIKENRYSIGEIAEMLGFNSMQYFSRKFYKRYHLTPSCYAKSIFKEELI